MLQLIIATVFGILSFFLFIPISPPSLQELKPISIVVLPWVLVSAAEILPLRSQGWLTLLFNSGSLGCYVLRCFSLNEPAGLAFNGQRPPTDCVQLPSDWKNEITTTSISCRSCLKLIPDPYSLIWVITKLLTLPQLPASLVLIQQVSPSAAVLATHSCSSLAATSK